MTTRETCRETIMCDRINYIGILFEIKEYFVKKDEQEKKIPLVSTRTVKPKNKLTNLVKTLI